MNPPNSSQPSPYQAPEFLSGVVQRITYHAEQSGYTVARLQSPRARELVTVVGNFANIQAGQTLELQGSWKSHPQYGQQFEVKQYTETKPATLTGMEKYLGSGLIKGVGPVTARRIVAHFGLQTLDIIEEKAERLIETPGIGKKRVTMIQKAWAEQKTIKEVMIFLQGHGVSTTYAVKIFKQYGAKAIATVTDNRYQLADDIYGIGFLTADRIARNVGVSPWSKYRYKSGLLHVLGQAAEEGHCFLPQPELIKLAAELLTIEGHEADLAAVETIIQEMGQQQALIIEMGEGGMPLCYSPAFFTTEKNLAQLLRQHLSRPVEADLSRIRHWIERFTKVAASSSLPNSRKLSKWRPRPG